MTVQDEVITSAPFPFLTEELILEKKYQLETQINSPLFSTCFFLYKQLHFGGQC